MQVKAATVNVAYRRRPLVLARAISSADVEKNPATGRSPAALTASATRSARHPGVAAAVASSKRSASRAGDNRLAPKSPGRPGNRSSGGDRRAISSARRPVRAMAAASSRFVLAEADRLPVTTRTLIWASERSVC